MNNVCASVRAWHYASTRHKRPYRLQIAVDFISVDRRQSGNIVWRTACWRYVLISTVRLSARHAEPVWERIERGRSLPNGFTERAGGREAQDPDRHADREQRRLQAGFSRPRIRIRAKNHTNVSKPNQPGNALTAMAQHEVAPWHKPGPAKAMSRIFKQDADHAQRQTAMTPRFRQFASCAAQTASPEWQRHRRREYRRLYVGRHQRARVPGGIHHQHIAPKPHSVRM